MYVCMYVLCGVVVVYVLCGVVVVFLGSGPEVLGSSPTQENFHLVFHLHPTSPPSCDWVPGICKGVNSRPFLMKLFVRAQLRTTGGGYGKVIVTRRTRCQVRQPIDSLAEAHAATALETV